MKKVTILLVAMLVALGFVGFVCAQQSAQPAKAAQPAVPAKKTVVKLARLTGEVVSVDSTASTITVKNKKGAETTLDVDAKAKIKKAGKTITLSEVSAGAKVTVSYKTEAGKKIATSISVKK